jgi:radical SAM protein with 4Fe4S-binding SPASM domain
MEIKLRSISWIINNRCNLNCIHCYPNSGKEIKPTYSPHQMDTICSHLETVSANFVFISGGEPLLDKQFLDYLRIACKIASQEVWICSNGLPLTEDILYRSGKEGATGYILSFQHHIPSRMDEICGSKGIYGKVMEAIARVKKSNLRFSLEMTLLRFNKDSIEPLIRLGNELEAKIVAFKRFRPIGRGKDHDDYGFPKEEYWKVLRYILEQSLKKNSVEIRVHDPMYGVVALKYFKEQGLKGEALARKMETFMGCNAGTRWIGIDPLGNVSSCPLLGAAGVTIGNILSQSLKEIIEKSEEIESLKKARQNKNTCDYWQICRGCRAHSFVTGGQFFAKDPLCIEDAFLCPSCTIS